MVGKSGKPPAAKQVKNREDCLKYFERGKSALYTAQQLGLNRNTVNSYFTDFREKLVETIDTGFINRQKTAKEMSMKDLDEEVDELDDLVEGLKELVKDEPDNSAWTGQLKQAIELRSNLKQQKHAIDMTPTIDVSVDKMAEELSEMHESSTSESE